MDEKVYKLFRELEIPFEKIEHPALFSCNDNEKYNLSFNGTICKNLFIRNSNKSQYYLIVLPIEKQLNLKDLQKLLNESRLSFSSETDLELKLKSQSGSVSLLNIINVESTDVLFVIDSSILKHSKVCFHPNINTCTIIFNPIYIDKILNQFDVKYMYKDL